MRGRQYLANFQLFANDRFTKIANQPGVDQPPGITTF